VRAALADYRSAPMDARLRGTLAFLEKLVLAPAELGPADAERARAAGASDRALEEAVYVAFAFGVLDRIADALDFEPNAGRSLAWASRILYRLGYGGASLRG
jgi:alkylhydroperoxidase family enzyme